MVYSSYKHKEKQNYFLNQLKYVEKQKYFPNQLKYDAQL